MVRTLNFVQPPSAFLHGGERCHGIAAGGPIPRPTHARMRGLRIRLTLEFVQLVSEKEFFQVFQTSRKLCLRLQPQLHCFCSSHWIKATA